MKNKSNTMVDYGFVTNLSNTLEKLDNTTRNALAVEAKVRPTTINDLASGKSKQINFETLSSILKALDRISIEKGYTKKHTVADIFEYAPEENKKETPEN